MPLWALCAASAPSSWASLDPKDFKFLWVTEFPMFEYVEEEGRYVAMHHPFTAPMDEDLDKLETDKAELPRQGLRHRPQRHRAGRRLHPYHRARDSAGHVPCSGLQR